MSTVDSLLTVVLWYFLPSFFASSVLSVTYYVTPASFRPTVSSASTPSEVAAANARAQLHSRNAHLFLVVAYFVYSLLSTYRAQAAPGEQHYYSLLDLPRELVEKEGSTLVKTHWRKLARVHHPDKVGKAGEEYFVSLRNAIEILEDETKRWAYERFGPQADTWGKLLLKREYLMAGLRSTLSFYIISLALVILSSWMQNNEGSVQFWRYLSLFVLFASEYSISMRPLPSRTLTRLLPNRLIFQHIAFLRQFFISTSFALPSMISLLFPQAKTGEEGMTQEEVMRSRERVAKEADAIRPFVEKMNEVIRSLEMEVCALQAKEYQPLLVRHPTMPEEVDASATKSDEDVIRTGVAAQAVMKGRAEADEKNLVIIEGLRHRMLHTYTDVAFRASSEGAAIWNRVTQKSSAL